MQKGLISKDKDGFYYQKPTELVIKSLTEKELELGNEKKYTIWKRIE